MTWLRTTVRFFLGMTPLNGSRSATPKSNKVPYPVGGRFIDILALDAKQGLVVIELKVSKGYDRVVGQLLRYMSWIKQHHAERGQNVRGIIAAREISEDLKLACSYLADVSLYEYEMSVRLKKVDL